MLHGFAAFPAGAWHIGWACFGKQAFGGAGQGCWSYLAEAADSTRVGEKTALIVTSRHIAQKDRSVPHDPRLAKFVVAADRDRWQIRKSDVAGKGSPWPISGLGLVDGGPNGTD